MIKNVTQTLLKVAFAAGLIYWMIHKGILDLSLFARLASPGLVVFVLLCVAVQVFINNYRWLLLMRGQSLKATFGYTMPLTFISMFFSFVMPGGVGGDVVKGYYVFQDHPHQKVSSAISIFMDRIIGFFVMIATAFIALFLNAQAVRDHNELKSVAVVVAFLFVGFIVFFTLALSRRLGKQVFQSRFGHFIFETLPGGSKIRVIYDAVHSYRAHPGAFAAAIVLSFFGQLPPIALVYAVALAMNITSLSAAVYCFLVPVGLVVLALPISPAGIGVGQAAFYFLFRTYLGPENQLGPTAVTILQVSSFAWGLVGAYFYLIRKKTVTA